MPGSVSRILTDVQYSFVQFCRSRQSLFFTLAFPGLLLIVLGYLLGFQAGPATLYYIDYDGSQVSRALIGEMGTAGSLDLRDGAGLDLEKMLGDGTVSAYVVIPQGFGSGVAAAKSGIGESIDLKLYYSRSSTASQAILASAGEAVEQFNMKTTGAPETVVLKTGDIMTSGLGSIDFLFPGILGMCVMFTAINETLSVLIRYRTTGLSHKLSATPLSTAEWNVAKILHGTLIMLLSVAVAIAVAWLVFGVRPGLGIVTVLLIIVGSLMFVGIGLIISNFVNDLKSVNAIAFSVTLPLMLISGSLFPVERLPVVLQFASIFSPLTCLNNGLRSSMITGDSGTAMANLMVGAFIALVLFSVGVAILMKNEGQDM